MNSTHHRDTPEAASPAERNPIDLLAESFLARLRQGEYPAIDEYTTKYPELAEEIRSVFPTLALLEQGGEALASQPPPRRPKSLPTQIGEYQILRVVGRGGMGVVYEAEHDTMRRRVALKVLPARSALDDVQLQRFYLEARVAGRLHHTNIVPVFEVGTDGVHHFYAMQFIQGQSLDVVFDELRKVRGIVPRPLEATIGAEPSCNAIGKDLAEGLVSGQFSKRPEFDVTNDLSAANADSDATVASKTGQTPLEYTDDACRQASEDFFETSASVSADLNSSTDQHDDYFHRVAKIALQIAEALSYAHGQGILHRDIKPSNVILDTKGTAWVADFGLAKDENAELTRSGDIIGTFRYMAPERFDGHTDARSDIYGLGLTLYELCTLRNAFRGRDRAHLVRAICHTEPVRPRKLNPLIPRDLETIILKAIEKRPGNRYQAARHMAEDLRLMLADRPIKSRRSSTLERTWRWCRRNPQQALLGICILLLLAVMSVGSLSFAFFARRKAEELANSQRVSVERLYRSLQAGAEASRWSGRLGQHFSSLVGVASATEVLSQLDWPIEDVQQELVGLRNSAIAAMALPDLRQTRAWSFANARAYVIFHPLLTCYAQADASGHVSVYSVADGNQQHTLAAPSEATTVQRMLFSPDGKYLAVHYSAAEGASCRVWDVDTGAVTLTLSPEKGPQPVFDFNADSTRLVLAHGKSLIVYRLSSGEQIHQVSLSNAVLDLRVCRTNDSVALLLPGRRAAQVLRADTGETQTFTFESPVQSMGWRPGTEELALGHDDGRLVLERVGASSASKPYRQRQFLGHTSLIVRVEFSPDGELMMSQAWDGTMRLWEVGSGQQLLRMEGRYILESGFSADGKHIGLADRSQFHLWEIARDTPLRILRSPHSTARRWSVDIDPTGRWLASAKNDGVEIWDLEKRQLSHILATKELVNGTSKDAEFLPSGKELLLSNPQGVQLYKMTVQNEKPIFTRSRTITTASASWASLDTTGTFAGFRDRLSSAMGLVVNLRQPSHHVPIGPHLGLDHVEVSPNGRWIATTTWGGAGGIHLWDAKSGERVTSSALEPTEKKCNVIFSDDSQQLFASTTRHHISWNLATMQTNFRVRRETQDDWPGPLAYSPEEGLLAVGHSRFAIALLDAQTGQTISVLGTPSEVGFHACCFSEAGRLLAAASDTDIHLWDLTKVRSLLRRVGLDL